MSKPRSFLNRRTKCPLASRSPHQQSGWALLLLALGAIWMVSVASLAWPSSAAACHNPARCPHPGVPDDPPDLPPPVTEPDAQFDWTMPDRSRDEDPKDGLLDMETEWKADFGHGMASGSKGLENWKKQRDWQVNFDACESAAPGGVTTYRWEIAGRAPETRTSCRADDLPSFPREGLFHVKLTVTGADGRTDSDEKDVHVQDRLIVTMGDSVASGQGNPDTRQLLWPISNVLREGGNAKWLEERCYRSANAASARAALALEQRDPRTSVTHVSTACSGAETGKGILSGYRGADPAFWSKPQLPPQVDQVADAVGERKIDDLLISIGGNDVGFVNIVESCWAKPFCNIDADTLSKFNDNAKLLEDEQYQTIKDRIAGKVNVASTYLSEYPDPTTGDNGGQCGSILATDPIRPWAPGLNAVELDWASNTVLRRLNDVGKAAADALDWRYIGGIRADSIGHGYCASEPKRWTRTFEEACDFQGPKQTGPAKPFPGACWIPDVQGTLHPNEKGHAAIANRILDALVANMPVPVLQPECSDGKDNDSDGKTDFQADPGCSSANDDSEAPDPDRTAPETQITSGPSGTVRSTNARFGFSSSEPGSDFECRRDGGPWSPCASPQAYSGLSQGAHTFEVAATDAAGNRDATPDTRSWKVDTLAPRVTVVSPSSRATRVSPTANVFATFSEAMKATTMTRTTVKLVRKGTTTAVAGRVIYDASRKRAKLDPSRSLRRGATYTATVKTGAKDLAGNPLARGRVWSFTVRK